MALYLLSHGASLSARCPFWLTFPLHVAVYSGYCTMVQLLLDCGADVNAGLSSGNNWSSNTGTTPLHIAARVGSPEMIQLLIEYGADVYAVASITGRTPLHIACARGDAEIIRLLILNGAPIHSSTKNRILYICSSLDRVAIVHMLLEYGGDVNATSGEANNKTLLHRAAGGSRNRGSPKMVELLIKCGADVAAADWKGKTPLHLACRNIVSKPLDEDYPGDAAKRRRDNMEVVRLLIANGAPLNAVDPSVGFTPLHTVCWGAVFGHYEKRGECMEAAKVLILSGAKLDVPSKEGKTALDILDEGRKRMSAWSSGYWFTACWFWCVKASGLKGSRLPGRATRPRCLPSTAALGEDQ
ncbi:ankyrin repeat-containing domain protein [Sphaerosporella brunnea]|uniref:Ankyrin repeat-containing domain protein n=1 Tax=Sphaerosporella brunnea TaxID=1250544 RepID=A0A5J5EME4_9PEZI|nr:ankyrin repeat-containing domain protein [Sphaerosporella brunnea]